MGKKEIQIIMKKKKLPYEEPEFLILLLSADVITDSFGNNPPDVEETETEDDNWGMGFQPF